jgi:hypothetical protein
VDRQAEEKHTRQRFEAYVAGHAVIPPEFERLHWSDPQNPFMMLQYLRDQENLIVLSHQINADAIYHWNAINVTLSAFARLDLEDFAEKCVASPYGTDFTEWDTDTARLKILILFQQIDQGERMGPMGDYTAPGLKENFYNHHGMAALSNPETWRLWLDDHGPAFFGGYVGFAQDRREGRLKFLLNIGMKIHYNCHAHLIGLKMAMEQLRSREEKE